MKMIGNTGIDATLKACGVGISKPRRAIYEYLVTHLTHPTVEEVYQGLCGSIPSLSRTTVYNTLRMFSERGMAQMITIDEHRVCYDGDTSQHVHFFCKRCGKITDMPGETSPQIDAGKQIAGNMVTEVQLYYKGICAECMKHAADEY